MSQSINPIAADAARKALTAGREREAGALVATSERADLDAQELRELELRQAGVAADADDNRPPVPTGRRGFLKRLFRR